jgi:hypothetical protein
VFDLSGGGMRKFDSSRILTIFRPSRIEPTEMLAKYEKATPKGVAFNLGGEQLANFEPIM